MPPESVDPPRLGRRVRKFRTGRRYPGHPRRCKLRIPTLLWPVVVAEKSHLYKFSKFVGGVQNWEFVVATNRTYPGCRGPEPHIGFGIHDSDERTHLEKFDGIPHIETR